MKEFRRETALRIAGIAICLISILLGCSVSKEKEQEVKKVKDIRIGAILPLTGPASYLGENEKKAIELAVKEINEKYNDEIIKILFEDSKGSTNVAVTSADKLLNTDKVSAFITSTTGISQVILPIANKNKIIIAMLCTDPVIQKESPYAFRLYESLEAESNQFLQYYSKTKEQKKVVVLYLNQHDTVKELTDYLIPGFMQNGINVVYYEPYDSGEKDFGTKVERIKHSGANSLVITGNGFEYVALFEALAQQKLLGKIEITGGWGFIMPNRVPSHHLEGVIVASPKYIFLKNEGAKIFEENFSKTYGHAPNLDTAFAYDATKILAQGLIDGLIEKKGTADTVSYKLINSIHNGVMGEVSIDSFGGLEVPMGLGVIKQGEIVPLSK